MKKIFLLIVIICFISCDKKPTFSNNNNDVYTESYSLSNNIAFIANSEDNNCLYITTKDGEYILFDNDGNYDEISYICFYALVAEKYLCEYQFGTSGWEEPEERNTFVSKYINYIFQIPLKGQINDNGIEECFNRVYYDFVKTNTSIERVDQGYNFREYNVGKEYYLILGTFCSWAKTFVITADDNGWLCVKYI